MRIKLFNNIFGADHSTLGLHLSPEGVGSFFHFVFADGAGLDDGLDVVVVQLLGGLGAQLDEVVGHGPQVQVVADGLVQFVAVVNHHWLVLQVHVSVNFVRNHLYLVSEPLQLQIREVFAPVYPVPYSSLNLKHYRYKNFLYHF